MWVPLSGAERHAQAAWALPAAALIAEPKTLGMAVRAFISTSGLLRPPSFSLATTFLPAWGLKSWAVLRHELLNAARLHLAFRLDALRGPATWRLQMGLPS